MIKHNFECISLALNESVLPIQPSCNFFIQEIKLSLKWQKDQSILIVWDNYSETSFKVELPQVHLKWNLRCDTTAKYIKNMHEAETNLAKFQNLWKCELFWFGRDLFCLLHTLVFFFSKQTIPFLGSWYNIPSHWPCRKRNKTWDVHTYIHFSLVDWL